MAKYSPFQGQNKRIFWSSAYSLAACVLSIMSILSSAAPRHAHTTASLCRICCSSSLKNAAAQPASGNPELPLHPRKAAPLLCTLFPSAGKRYFFSPTLHERACRIHLRGSQRYDPGDEPIKKRRHSLCPGEKDYATFLS